MLVAGAFAETALQLTDSIIFLAQLLPKMVDIDLQPLEVLDMRGLEADLTSGLYLHAYAVPEPVHHTVDCPELILVPRRDKQRRCFVESDLSTRLALSEQLDGGLDRGEQIFGRQCVDKQIGYCPHVHAS